MTLQTILGGLWIPRPLSGVQNATPGLSTDSITTTSGGVGIIFRVPKSGTISKVAFMMATVTTNGTLDARLETVDLTTGAPSGTLYATGANATFTPSAGWTTITLGTPAVVTAGDYIALVVKATGVTVSVTVQTQVTPGAGDALLPMPMRLSGGTWSKRTARPTFGLEYNDGSYPWVPDAFSVSAVTLTSYNSGSAADEYALKFKLPFPARVSGWWAYLDMAGDFDVVLYDTDGTTVLKSQSMDKDVKQIANNGMVSGLFASGQAILANSFYYLSLKPTSVTSIQIARWSVNAAALMDALEGGQNFHEATRVDAGAWTAAPTNRPVYGIIFDQFDDGGTTTETSVASAG